MPENVSFDLWYSYNQLCSMAAEGHSERENVMRRDTEFNSVFLGAQTYQELHDDAFSLSSYVHPASISLSLAKTLTSIAFLISLFIYFSRAHYRAEAA